MTHPVAERRRRRAPSRPAALRVLSIVHRPKVHPNVFDDVLREREHHVERWSLASGRSPRHPPETYDAIIVYGGRMHADQAARFPWLVDETRLLRRLLDATVPVLAICLGAQLLARAAGASVYRAPAPEIGWYPVELTDAGCADLLFGKLPERFVAFEWHHYSFDLPAGARKLARSAHCTQAFALGPCAWGVQFHPEVRTPEIVAWTVEHGRASASLLAECERRIGEWNELGRDLCTAFCTLADLNRRTGGARRKACEKSQSGARGCP